MSASTLDDGIEAIIARTALKYDLLPYQSKPFPQSQPSRLAAIARLFKLEAAPLETARVLELGCASGGNIIPHAARYPNATFVGVDLARTQVAAGRARIARLGLNNIEIRCQSFTEIGDELGEFDYIICHGVYSWVPAVVQDHIFRIIRARLSPVGVACVSYNVLPGWRMLQPLRDAFMLNVPDHIDSRGRVAQARELLRFLSASSPDKGPYGDMLRVWAGRLEALPDDYVAHEFLEEVNEPSTVRAFTASAARHGLGFLAECDLASMVLENYGPEVAQQVRARANNNLIECEQYLDLLSGRTFRQSLLVASERQTMINRALEPDRLENLHFLTSAGMKIERGAGSHVVTDAAGRTLTTGSDDVADGLERLMARFPASSRLEDCLRGVGEGQDGVLRDVLYRMVLAGMITVSSETLQVGDVEADTPVALPLARADAAEGADYTTNIRHEQVVLDAASRAILPIMDGGSDRAALVSRLVDEALVGKLSFTRDGKPVTGEKDLKSLARQHLPSMMQGLVKAGLIERGSPNIDSKFT